MIFELFLVKVGIAEVIDEEIHDLRIQFIHQKFSIAEFTSGFKSAKR